METIAQYLTYNNDPELIRDTFISLDNQLKIIHERGYYVDINSSSIVLENGNIGFNSINKGLSPITKQNNIEDLAKLAIGAYFSLPTGTFTDYTHLPTSYIMDHFDQMEGSILKSNKDDNYYKDVLVEGKNTRYYNDYLKDLSEKISQERSNNKSNTLVKSTAVGKAMTREDAAFVDILFYPIIITAISFILYIAYVLI